MSAMPTIANGNPSVGLGILSWKSNRTLRASLETHRAAGLLDLFDDALIFFQEIGDEDRALAAEFGLRAEGAEENLGIMGGMKRIAELLRTDYVLHLENDMLTTADSATLRRQLAAAVTNMESGAVKYTWLAWRLQGETDKNKFKKYVRFHPSPALGVEDSLLKKIRRTLRPVRAERAIRDAVLLGEGERFPHLVRQIEHGYYAVDTRATRWSNLVPFYPPKWFLQELIPWAEAHPSSRPVNGKSDLEADINRKWWQSLRWWRTREWRVGISRQELFVHNRLERPVHDEKGDEGWEKGWTRKRQPRTAAPVLVLSGRQPFAASHKRQIFVHPHDPGKCIKVQFKSGATIRAARGFPHTLRPAAYYEEVIHEEKSHRRFAILAEIHPGVYDHIPRYYGSVQTDLGRGNILQLLRDFDGEISQNLRERLRQARTCPAVEESVRRSIEEFRVFMRDIPAITGRLHCPNIVSVRLDEHRERLYLIDDLHPRELLSFYQQHIPHFRRKRHERHWARFSAEVEQHLHNPKGNHQ